MKGLEQRVVVAAGGKSHERSQSLKTGASVYESLREQGYPVVIADPAENRGLEKMRTADVVFLAVPGKYGEDGTLQGFLDLFDVPYIGSGVRASALGMHKPSFKRILQANGIPTLPFSEVPVDSDRTLVEDVTRVIDEHGGAKAAFPLFAKPVAEGSSLGTALVNNPAELQTAIEANMRDGYGDTMVEPFVHSRSFTVGLLEIDGKLAVLPVVEIKPQEAFNSVAEKLLSRPDKFDCPAKIPGDLFKTLQELAFATHKAIGAHGISRVDFLMGDDGAPYVGEINTLPGLRRSISFPKMAAEHGLSYNQMIEHVLKTAFTKSE